MVSCCKKGSPQCPKLPPNHAVWVFRWANTDKTDISCGCSTVDTELN